MSSAALPTAWLVVLVGPHALASDSRLCFRRSILRLPTAAAAYTGKAASAFGFGAPRDLGLMLYDVDHTSDRYSMFLRALDRGVLEVPAPDSSEVRR
jgi:hypothetical protein